MTTTATNPLEELKARQQKTWSSGDYGKIAWITTPLADVLCESVDLRAGSSVLDVATGTGHVALAAARRFCNTTGIDYVPALIETAQQRAVAEELDVDFRVGDAEALPCADESYDFVLSAIGVMFTANHAQAASELARVCKPGGRIGLVNWTPTGFVGRMLETVATHVAPPAGAKSPTLWGTEEYMRELLGEHTTDISFETRTVEERFPSTERYADFFLANYGPTLKAAEALDEAGRAAFRADLVALADRHNRATDGTFVADWEYVTVVATR